MSKIKEARLLTGMTQKSAAEFFEVPQRTWERWEAGTVSPPHYAEKLILEKLQEKEREIKIMLLKEKIERAIEKETMNSGKMGSETVSVELELTSEEKKSFLAINDFDNPHYSWDFDGNFLTINYTEDL